MSSSTLRPKALVGIDGSTISRNALQWATTFARANNGSVSAVMAWSYPTALMMPVVGAPVVGAPVVPADLLANNARVELSSIVAAYESAQVVTEQWVVMGSPRGVLTEASEDHDVLVVGRTGKGRLQRLLLGSTPSYCVRHAECPVVIVDEATAPEKRIVVAVDGSSTSIAALAWVLRFAGEHEILAVYSHDEWELDDLALDSQLRADLDTQADNILQATIADAANLARVDAASVTRQVRQGDPRTTIVDQGDPEELLVLGAQGHSGIARWMLGSLADYAVLHAAGSVAIWR